MLSRVSNIGLSMARQLIQQSSKSVWMGRSVTALCPGCDTRCPQFMEAHKKKERCKLEDQGKEVTDHSADSSDEPAFGEALLPRNQINPLYPYQKGLLKPNSMLHPAHPVNWEDSPKDSPAARVQEEDNFSSDGPCGQDD